jgi:hypothetical protein
VCTKAQCRVHGTTSPTRDRLITWASTQPDWAIGFLDEVWWSCFVRPRMHAWQDDTHPVRLVEQSYETHLSLPEKVA